jgi:hypothetical protein
MIGLSYNSVATVALHVNNLIKRGHLIKRDHSARSLEPVGANPSKGLLTNEVSPKEEKWLVEKIEHLFREVEQSAVPVSQEVDNLIVLVGAMKVLGLEGAAQSFSSRLKELKRHLPT